MVVSGPRAKEAPGDIRSRFRPVYAEVRNFLSHQEDDDGAENHAEKNAASNPHGWKRARLVHKGVHKVNMQKNFFESCGSVAYPKKHAMVGRIDGFFRKTLEFGQLHEMDGGQKCSDFLRELHGIIVEAEKSGVDCYNNLGKQVKDALGPLEQLEQLLANGKIMAMSLQCIKRDLFKATRYRQLKNCEEALKEMQLASVYFGAAVKALVSGLKEMGAGRAPLCSDNHFMVRPHHTDQVETVLACSICASDSSTKDAEEKSSAARWRCRVCSEQSSVEFWLCESCAGKNLSEASPIRLERLCIADGWAQRMDAAQDALEQAQQRCPPPADVPRGRKDTWSNFLSSSQIGTLNRQVRMKIRSGPDDLQQPFLQSSESMASLNELEESSDSDDDVISVASEEAFAAAVTTRVVFSNLDDSVSVDGFRDVVLGRWDEAESRVDTNADQRTRSRLHPLKTPLKLTSSCKRSQLQVHPLRVDNLFNALTEAESRVDTTATISSALKDSAVESLQRSPLMRRQKTVTRNDSQKMIREDSEKMTRAVSSTARQAGEAERGVLHITYIELSHSVGVVEFGTAEQAIKTVRSMQGQIVKGRAICAALDTPPWLDRTAREGRAIQVGGEIGTSSELWDLLGGHRAGIENITFQVDPKTDKLAYIVSFDCKRKAKLGLAALHMADVLPAKQAAMLQVSDKMFQLSRRCAMRLPSLDCFPELDFGGNWRMAEKGGKHCLRRISLHVGGELNDVRLPCHRKARGRALGQSPRRAPPISESALMSTTCPSWGTSSFGDRMCGDDEARILLLPEQVRLPALASMAASPRANQDSMATPRALQIMQRREQLIAKARARPTHNQYEPFAQVWASLLD